jgi:CreA protein
MRLLSCAALLCLSLATPARAKDGELGCVTTTWKLLGANHKVCVSSFRDPEVAGVVCHLSQARTGGVKGSVGLAEDVSEFSLSCVQTGPIPAGLQLPEQKEVFTERTSLIFKGTHVVRMFDRENNTLVYLAISRKVVDGSPRNAVSNVAISPWAQATPPAAAKPE